ncbi:CHAT domain-containing protein [Lactifluus subvellereus]|nr:CHAT domain-containing protein [Lactifluus subvellereus]
MYSNRYFAEIDPPSFVSSLILVIGAIFATILRILIATWLGEVLSTTQHTPALSSPHEQPRPTIPHEQPCLLLHEQLRPALSHEQPYGQPRKGKVSRHVTIETLPDDVLIEIFNFYRLSSVPLGARVRPWEWNRLVHVCRRWRYIIFDSPRYFDLRTLCTYAAPVGDILDHWPTFPIIIQYAGFSSPSPLATGDEDNIVVALQQTDRLCIIQLTVTIPLLEGLSTQPQEPFPALEQLELVTQTETGLTLPSNCFGGAAPLLRVLRTAKIGFPALPQLLLSAENLVSLQLEAIPSAGYISPEDLIISLPIMIRLTMFHLHFLSPTSRPISGEHQPPQRRAVLPALKYFAFHGVSEYLECLVSGIDTPLLKYIFITFFNQAIIDIPKLSHFVYRTETQSSSDEARVYYSGNDISIILTRGERPHRMGLRVRCVSLDWQLSCMAEICENLSLTLSGVRQLDISASPQLQIGQDDIDPLPFLELFRPFSNVEGLRVAKEAASHVACALGQEHVDMGVFPELRELYIEGHGESTSGQQAFAPFITMRRQSGHPVIVHPWEPNNDLQPLVTPTPTPAILRYDPILELEKDTWDTCKQFDTHPRPFAVQSLFQQAQSLLLSFMQSGRVEDLENSIEVSQDLLEMHTKQIRRVKLFGMLAFSFALRSQSSGNMARSISMFEAAFQDEFATTTEKLGIGWWWATFTRVWNHPSTTLVYQDTLSALRCSFIGQFTIQIQPISIGRLGSAIQVPFEYASHQIGSGQLELAVEAIEQGKTLIWSEMYGLRVSAARLRRFNPDLADRLMTVSQDLEAVNNSIPVHGATGSPLYAGDHEDIGIFNPTLREQQRLLGEREKVIREIQALPGFENFMKAIPFRTLQNAASRGPIIIVNHCRWRCDILIVLHDSLPSLIPTRAGFFERATALATDLVGIRREYPLESKQYYKALKSVLEELYEHIGQPVIDRLRELGIAEQSRVWWYPTSVFCSLPLHAMGPIPSTVGDEQYFSDIYVCSYTPTLSALMEAHSPATAIPDPVTSLLFVCPGPSLPGMKGEMAAIKRIGIPVTMLLGENATRQAVNDGLQEHRIVHFASHGSLEVGDPFNTALWLSGGDRLTLLDIVCARIPTTELAVLSGCHTAELTEGAEGLNLAAAMQYYGFRSVVGTMWSMADIDGRDFSRPFYRTLLSQVGTDGDPLEENSAEAFRLAVQRLRMKEGMTLERWVNWVHYGA